MEHPFRTTLYPGQLESVNFPVKPSTRAQEQSQKNVSFENQLQKSLLKQELIFSAHATTRLNQRKIILSSEDVEQMSQAIDRVAEKGGQDALLFYKNTAFVINVKNRTVITAVDGANLKSNVFTQIDSAVIL